MAKSLAQHAALLHALYATITQPSAWQEALSSLVQLTNSRSARLLILNQYANIVHDSIKHNIDDAFHQQYTDHFVNLCPWRPELADKNSGRLYSTFLDFSCEQSQFLQSEFFHEWAKPQDIHHGLCGTIFESGQTKVQLLIQRTESQGHYTREDQHYVNQLVVPHLVQTLQLHEKIATLRQAEALRALGVVAPGGLLLLNESGQIRYACPNGEFFVRQYLATQNDQIIWERPTDQQHWQQLCQAATLTLQGHFSTVRPLPVAQSGFQLRVTPIAREQQLLSDQLSGVCMAVLIQPISHIPSFSPREHQLATALAQGETLADYATRSLIGRETARSQLKSLFAKTGTNRQHELVVWWLRNMNETVSPLSIISPLKD